MEKLSLLEKLKTLQRWQLQQQHDFAKIKSNNDDRLSEHEEGDSFSDDVDGDGNYDDNDGIIENRDFIVMEPIEKNRENTMLTQTMTNRALTDALNDIQLDSQNEILDKELRPTVKHTTHVYDNASGSESEAIIKQNRFLQSGELNNWHMSGMQTVVLQNNPLNLNEYTSAGRIPVGNLEGLMDKDVMTSESDDGFSEIDINHEMEGIKPISETDEEADDFQDSDKECEFSEGEDEETIIENIESAVRIYFLFICFRCQFPFSL